MDNRLKKLDSFLNMLASRQSSESVYNQYKDERLLHNLKTYFSYLLTNGYGPLMIGEAPGYKGCRITGIPFTSSNQISHSKHKIFTQNSSDFFLSVKKSENTASIVWEKIKTDTTFPVFWNAFPFHPHKKDNSLSNRRPVGEETEEGKKYIALLLELFPTKRIYAIGNVSYDLMRNNFPGFEVVYIRHPSFGGKKGFLKKIVEEKLEAWSIP